LIHLFPADRIGPLASPKFGYPVLLSPRTDAKPADAPDCRACSVTRRCRQFPDKSLWSNAQA
jgi:hypothetical protein